MSSALPWSIPMRTPPKALTGRATVDEIDAILRTRPWWQVSLPPALEQACQVDALDARLSVLQRSGWLSLLIFNAFLVVDWLMANDVFVESVMIRLLLFTPAGLALLWLARQRQAQWVRQARTDVGEIIVVVSGWAAGASLAAILLQSHSPLAMYYHAGYLVVVIYGVLLQALRFRWAVLYAAGMLLMHMWSAQAGQAMPEPLRLSLLHLMVCTTGLALAANHMVERARRRRYLLRLREQCLLEQLGGIHERLQQMSRSDVLTGVANRRHFHEHLQQLWQRALVDQSQLSVLMLDVDHFKAYNDHHGHPAGDACLRQVAQAMATSLRMPLDFVARYGGEEFVAILPGANAHVAKQVAERVRQGIQACGIEHRASQTATVVTASIGVATMVPGAPSAHGPDQLIAHADRALYEAKRISRNCVCLYGEL